MRYTALGVIALPLLAALAMCQSADDANVAALLQNVAKNEDNDSLNLDPNLDETDVGRDTPGKEVKPPEVVPCTTRNGERGICVTYYQCDLKEEKVIDDGYSIIDIREGSQCKNFLVVCCRTNKVLEPKPKDVTAVVNDKTTMDSAQGTDTQTRCGLSNPGISILRNLKINEADFGEFPWMIAVLKRTKPDEKWDSKNYVGGGSLINKFVVMTAAHKIRRWKAEQLKIRAGEYDSKSEDELYPYQERDVRKIVIHENFDTRTVQNDIALLFLDTPVDLSAPNIGIGCIGKKLLPPNTECYSMGWGNTDFNNKSIYATVLKKVKLPLVDKKDCEEMLKKTRLGEFYTVHESLTCAGGKAGVDTCKGDGGSPLVCPINDGGTRFAIYGMVAYGISCGVANQPAVYVNVPYFNDWIQRQLKMWDYDYNSYVYYET